MKSPYWRLLFGWFLYRGLYRRWVFGFTGSLVFADVLQRYYRLGQLGLVRVTRHQEAA